MIFHEPSGGLLGFARPSVGGVGGSQCLPRSGAMSRRASVITPANNRIRAATGRERPPPLPTGRGSDKLPCRGNTPGTTVWQLSCIAKRSLYCEGGNMPEQPPSDPTRRDFLATAGALGAGLVAAGAADDPPAAPADKKLGPIPTAAGAGGETHQTA